MIWALLPSILVSQTILEAPAHGNFSIASRVYVSPDKEQVLVLDTKAISFIRRNGNIYNETIETK